MGGKSPLRNPGTEGGATKQDAYFWELILKPILWCHASRKSRWWDTLAGMENLPSWRTPSWSFRMKLSSSLRKEVSLVEGERRSHTFNNSIKRPPGILDEMQSGLCAWQWKNRTQNDFRGPAPTSALTRHSHLFGGHAMEAGWRTAVGARKLLLK